METEFIHREFDPDTGEIIFELPMIAGMALDLVAQMNGGCYRHPDGDLRYDVPPPPPDWSGDPRDEGR